MDTISSTERIKFLKDCFYLAFIEGKEYKNCIEPFVDKTNDIFTFNLVDFVESLKEKNETFGLVPVECLYESKCSKELLKQIEDEFDYSYNNGGFTRLFLEQLNDKRFKKEFNKLLNDKCSYPAYFSTKTTPGLYNFDLVGDYLDKIKDSWNIYSDSWDFIELTERVAIRNTATKSIIGVEKISSNPFSAYKFYGQEMYSRIFISTYEYLKNREPEPKDPYKAIEESTKIIFSDTDIKESLPERVNGKEVRARIYERDADMLKYELQRFFDDYIPSDLDRKYPKNGKHKGETLKNLLIRDFKGIATEEWSLFKKVNNNPYKYEKLSNRQQIFTNYECKFIKSSFDKIRDLDISFSYLSEKINYLMVHDFDEKETKTWKRIVEKYKQYFPPNIEGPDGNLFVQERDKYYFSIENNLCKDESKEKIIEYFNRYFAGEEIFLSSLESDIKCLSSLNIIDFFTQLKGAKDHPWGRFFTIYKRNSELSLYPTKTLFTKVMNQIETELVQWYEKNKE